jgi:hypothetical protein
MTISNLILQNEKLSIEMKIFDSEIERLVKIRDLILQRPTTESAYNIDVVRKLTGRIHKVKAQFSLLNLAYEQDTHERADVFTSAFIRETREGCQEIEDILLKLKF